MSEGDQMTYFERYFERLDGDDRLSALELVAENLEFSIQWAAGADRKSSQFLDTFGSIDRRVASATRPRKLNARCVPL